MAGMQQLISIILALLALFVPTAGLGVAVIQEIRTER